MMLPPLPLARICLKQARVVRNAPSRWIASIFFHSAKPNSSIGWTIWIPALLISTSMLPKAFSVACTAASTCASSVTSTATPIAFAPLRVISAAAASAACLFRSAIATLAPWRANSLAISRPMPLAAPVMNAVLPWRRDMFVVLLNEGIGSKRPAVPRQVELRDAGVDAGGFEPLGVHDGIAHVALPRLPMLEHRRARELVVHGFELVARLAVDEMHDVGPRSAERGAQLAHRRSVPQLRGEVLE